MPTYSTAFYNYCPERAKRLDAWRRHYEAKGCSARKASQLADKKRWKTTWPPS